jgi:hypothetical protein
MVIAQLDECLLAGTDYTVPVLLDSVASHRLHPIARSWVRPRVLRGQLVSTTSAHQSNMQTKRFHISGLTPAISEKDLNSRFSVFGTVKAVHGVGQLNAVGQPRNFAFLSLEATPEKISKCKPVSSHNSMLSLI